MKLYKLTADNAHLWGEMVTHTANSGLPAFLCTAGVIHAYKNINLAFLLNPAHADFTNPLLWEAEGEVAVADWGKVGCRELTTIRQLPLPKWVGGAEEPAVRVRFAVLCAELVLQIFSEKYPADNRPQGAINAARKWLKTHAAYAAAHSAAYTAEAAADAAEAAAYGAAYAAASAAHAAAYAAYAAYAAAYTAEAAEAAAYTAEAAAYAAQATAYAEAEAADFCALADRAVRGEL